MYQTPGILPDGFHVYSWGFFNTTRDQLAAVLGAAACIIALVVLVEKSRFGLSARAVVDRPPLAEGVGINTTRLGAVAWIIAVAMTGVAGILLSPLIQLDAAQYTTLSVAALSVALVGRFRSLTITALAGVGLGVAASLLTGYAPVGSVIGNGLVPACRSSSSSSCCSSAGRWRRPPGRRRRERTRRRGARSRRRRRSKAGLGSCGG